MNFILAINTFITNAASTVAVLEAEVGGNVSFEPVKKIIIALIVGLVVGLIYALSLKGQLTSVYKNESAADYTRDKSFIVNENKELFLYSKTEKTEKPQQAQQPQATSNRR